MNDIMVESSPTVSNASIHLSMPGEVQQEEWRIQNDLALEISPPKTENERKAKESSL
jgi:hypothetical protein